MFLSPKQCCLLLLIGRTTLMQRWSNPKSKWYVGFPSPVPLGLTRAGKRRQCRLGFPKHEVDEWIQARLKKRQTPST